MSHRNEILKGLKPLFNKNIRPCTTVNDVINSLVLTENLVLMPNERRRAFIRSFYVAYKSTNDCTKTKTYTEYNIIFPRVKRLEESRVVQLKPATKN